MNINEIREKIIAEQENLKTLEDKKKIIDTKIASKRKRIEDYQRMLQAKEYSEIDDKLENMGLSREDLINAFVNNDLSLLQEKLQEKIEDKEKTEHTFGGGVLINFLKVGELA